jgi:hypothetical protein
MAAAPLWAAWRAGGGGLDAGWLLASFAGLLASNLLYVACWRRWLAGLGHPLTYRDAFRVIHLANLAKYLPGVAWHFVGRVAMGARLGVPPEATAAAIGLEAVMHLATALLFGALALLAAGGLPGAPSGWIALAVVGALLACHPRVVGAALALAARLLRRPPVVVDFGWGFLAGAAALYLLNWLVAGAAFAAFGRACAAGPLEATQVAALAGGMPLAWALGALAVFAPAGLGVREAGLAAILAPAFPLAPAAWPVGVALASRLWFMAGEALAFAAAWALPAGPDASSPGERPGAAGYGGDGPPAGAPRP